MAASASRTGVNDGGSATYTVSPDKSYTLDTVTLRVGSRQETAHVDEDSSIRVGGKSYPMSLSNQGVLKITVSNIRDDVQLSACAVRESSGTLYLRSGITAPYFEGMGNYRFCPEDTLTRAEAVKLINRVTSRSLCVYTIQTRFADVPASHWAFWDIISAANQV